MITRKRQLLEANWDEYQAEEESRERIKRMQVYFIALNSIRDKRNIIQFELALNNNHSYILGSK